MSDPLLSGLLSSEDESVVTDTLGRQSPISLRGQPTLPVGGAPVSGGAGPVAPGGTGVGPTFTGGGRGATQPGPDALGGKLLGLGERTLEKLARSGLGDSQTAARNPETEQAFQAQRAGERADLSGAGVVPAGAPPFPIPGDVLSGASGGGAFTGDLASQVPFQIPEGVLSGASGGGAVGGGLAAGAGADAASAGAESAALASGVGGAAAGGAATPALSASLAPLLGAAGVWAGPLLSFALSQLEPARSPYTRQREKAYSKLGQQVEGGFMPTLQEAVGKGPEAVQSLLTPEKLKEWGLEVQTDPQSGEYIVGLSSVGHPYVKYSDALNAQTQLSQAVNQALQLSRAFQLAQPPTEAAPTTTPQKPPTTPAGGGPLGLAEIGLEVGR